MCGTSISKSKSFYTADCSGTFKQFSYDDQTLINDFGQPFKTFVKIMMKTPDEKYLYIGCSGGYLFQWSIEENKTVKDFGEIHSHSIVITEITKNGKY